MINYIKMDFKKALFISFIGHCFLLTPLGNFGIFSPQKKTDNLQITYYKMPPQKAEALRTTAPAPSAQPLEKQPPAQEKRKREKSQVIRRIKPPQVKPSDLKPEEIVSPKKENIRPPSIPGTTLPNTPECMTYYHYIREEIRRFLKRNYTPEYEEGDVIVSFLLNQAGELAALNIVEDKSSNSPALRKLSYESIRNAAPFKPFPKGLTLKQISFNLTIVFKQK